MEKTILIVDDEEGTRELASELLRHNGFDVIASVGGTQFLEDVESGKIDPSVIDAALLDIMMPGMVGTDLCRRMKESDDLKHIKVAFLTVVEPEKVGMELIEELGAKDYIKKPYENEVLVEKVKKLFAE